MEYKVDVDNNNVENTLFVFNIDKDYEGYYKDNDFYNDSSHTSKITPVEGKVYKDLTYPSKPYYYVYNSKYVLINDKFQFVTSETFDSLKKRTNSINDYINYVGEEVTNEFSVDYKGFYYNGKFYEEKTHEKIISPEKYKIYGDLIEISSNYKIKEFYKCNYDFDGYYNDDDGLFYENKEYTILLDKISDKVYKNISDNKFYEYISEVGYEEISSYNPYSLFNPLSIYVISQITDNRVTKKLPSQIVINATTLDGTSINEFVLKTNAMSSYVTKELFEKTMNDFKEKYKKYNTEYNTYLNDYNSKSVAYTSLENKVNTIRDRIFNTNEIIEKQTEMRGKL